MVRALFPGTFDPIHYGHMDIAIRASRLFDELVIAVYDRPLKNLLFSPEERLSMVRTAFVNEPKIRVIGYSGLTVDACRASHAQVLANHRLKPDIDVVALITNEEHTFLSSTTVREIASLGGDISSMVPLHVSQALHRRFKELGESHQIIPQSSLRD
jgi:pantetheine-phosphate adenylyltransferase